LCAALFIKIPVEDLDTDISKAAIILKTN